MHKLSARQHGLSPISDADVPQEILPLIRTIDALFGRLREAIDSQETFIADAAHQLRTPLAGLRLHVERALAEESGKPVSEPLLQIGLLTERVGRTSTQLLALLRAHSPQEDEEALTVVDLARLVRDTVTGRVPDGLRAGVDLGYEGPSTPVLIEGSAAGLTNLLDNLIDNALIYAGRGGSVTVSLRSKSDGNVTLMVEDNGPGVPTLMLPRLGERFFRVPGSPDGGTGLGLAIVLRIAERHHAAVDIAPGTHGGLRVSIHFNSPSGRA
jgi:two-component system sensor histidine kinase TctE